MRGEIVAASSVRLAVSLTQLGGNRVSKGALCLATERRLHPGHIMLLRKAAEGSDRMVRSRAWLPLLLFRIEPHFT